MYLGQEVDLKAGCPVALRLPIVQIVTHRQNKLSAKEPTLSTDRTQTDSFTFGTAAVKSHLQDLGQLLAAPQLH